MNERHLINDLFSHLEKRKKEKSEKEKEREIQPPSSLGALGLHKKKVNKESDTGRKGRKNRHSASTGVETELLKIQI